MDFERNKINNFIALRLGKKMCWRSRQRWKAIIDVLVARNFVPLFPSLPGLYRRHNFLFNMNLFLFDVRPEKNERRKKRGVLEV